MSGRRADGARREPPAPRKALGTCLAALSGLRLLLSSSGLPARSSFWLDPPPLPRARTHAHAHAHAATPLTNHSPAILFSKGSLGLRVHIGEEGAQGLGFCGCVEPGGGPRNLWLCGAGPGSMCRPHPRATPPFLTCWSGHAPNLSCHFCPPPITQKTKKNKKNKKQDRKGTPVLCVFGAPLGTASCCCDHHSSDHFSRPWALRHPRPNPMPDWQLCHTTSPAAASGSSPCPLPSGTDPGCP